MDNLGAVFGIISCLLLINAFGFSFINTLFLLASVPSFIGAILVFAFIRDRKTSKISKGFSLKDLTFNFRLFLVLSALFALGFSATHS